LAIVGDCSTPSPSFGEGELAGEASAPTGPASAASGEASDRSDIAVRALRGCCSERHRLFEERLNLH
jgi:hypothetical protein